MSKVTVQWDGGFWMVLEGKECVYRIQDRMAAERFARWLRADIAEGVRQTSHAIAISEGMCDE